MTDEPKAAPPGWYPTPDGRQRYWDGRQWTDHFTTGLLYVENPYAAKKSGALKWVLLAVGLILVVGGGTCVALLSSVGGDGSGGGDDSGGNGVFVECDPDAVRSFQSLPAFPGVDVDLRGSEGSGCTDTVQPADPDAFLTHYEQAMRDAGWQVVRTGDDLLATGPTGDVQMDHYEGNDVEVFLQPGSGFLPDDP